MDLESLRIGGVGMLEPAGQRFSPGMPVILTLTVCSLSGQPSLGNSDDVPMVARPVLWRDRPLGEEVEGFAPSSNLLQAEAV